VIYCCPKPPIGENRSFGPLGLVAFSLFPTACAVAAFLRRCTAIKGADHCSADSPGVEFSRAQQGRC
jgi:hypothetical protein